MENLQLAAELVAKDKQEREQKAITYINEAIEFAKKEYNVEIGIEPINFNFQPKLLIKAN